MEKKILDLSGKLGRFEQMLESTNSKTMGTVENAIKLGMGWGVFGFMVLRYSFSTAYSFYYADK